MTDQTIIDDAKAAGLSFLGVKSSDRWKALFDFVAIRDIRAKASKQVQGEAVAIVDVEGKIHLNMTDLNAIRKAGKEINLYASPPQPQTVADALEEAAKICDYQSKRHGDKANDENDEVECSILKSTAWQFSIAARDIRNLITTQPKKYIEVGEVVRRTEQSPNGNPMSVIDVQIYPTEILSEVGMKVYALAPPIQGNTEGEK